MASDKNSRTRKSGNSKTPIEGQLPSDTLGVEGNEGTQVLSLLTGGSKEPGLSTRTQPSVGTHDLINII